MILVVLPMVELVGVAEGVHNGLEDRFQNLRVAIYTKSIHKKIQEASSKITTHCRPPRKCVKQTSFFLPPLLLFNNKMLGTNSFVYINNIADISNNQKMFCMFFFYVVIK